MLKRAIGVPGFYYFESESSFGLEEENKKIFDDLSLVTRVHIFIDVVVYEYLSQIFIFRWIFNVYRLLVALLDIYPILAIIRFGKKYAIVKIMKTKKS